MQQTETYKLNLIEPSDTFGPEALNKNAETLETHLARLDAAAAAEKTRVDAALSAKAAQTEITRLDAAAAAEKTRVDAALSAKAAQTEVTRLDAQLARVDGEAARCLVFKHTGNGANVITHTFAAPPKVIILWSGDDIAGGILCMATGQQYAIRSRYTTNSYLVELTWGEKSVTITARTTPEPGESICNRKNKLYFGLVVV